MSKIDFSKAFVDNKRAEFVFFDNSEAAIPGNPDNLQDAVKNLAGVALVQYVPFQFLGNMEFNRYLVSGYQITTSGVRYSGNSNGYRNRGCAPVQIGITGRVKAAALTVQGLAVSTGSPAPVVELKFELWKVGWRNEGTRLGDVIFNIDSSQFTIGTWWNSSVRTEFQGKQVQDIPVTAGDLLALKFIRQQANDKIVASLETTVTLEVQVG